MRRGMVYFVGYRLGLYWTELCSSTIHFELDGMRYRRVVFIKY